MNCEKIEVLNKSSLISLKAELIRKREEANLKPKCTVRNGLRFKNQDNTNNSINEPIKEPLEDLTSEEKDLEQLSKTILTAKSVIYDKLCNNQLISDNSQNNYLVNFDAKTNESKTNENSTNDSCKNTKGNDDWHEVRGVSSNDNGDDDDDGWVDYVDNFGRTRRCLREDLPYYKKLDIKLSNQNICAENNEEVKGNEELRSWDMAREALRTKWEEQEQLLAQKTDIHYEDIRFDEARQHGTAYYKFSVVEEERKRQQEELLRLRKETEEKQENNKLIKERRDALLKARIDAAKKRKRIRLGLPEDETEEEPSESQEEDNTAKDDSINNIEEMNTKILENLEKIRRLTHVRPWDIGKQGVSTAKVMSQEEWNVKKRQERPQEFAPPTSYNDKSAVDKFNRARKPIVATNDGNKVLRNDDEESICNEDRNTSSENNRAKEEVGDKTTDESVDDQFGSSSLLLNVTRKESNPLYFTTKRPKFKTKTPINFQISNDASDNCMTSTTAKTDKAMCKGVEIPPPVSYGMTDLKTKFSNKTASNRLSESVEAGIKFLQHEAEVDEMKRLKGMLM